MASAVLLDIDGVLTVSSEPLPGAVETLRWMREQGIAFGLVTNTSSKPRREIASNLNDMGIEVTSRQIFTAVSSAKRFLTSRYPGEICLVVNQGPLEEDLTGIETADPSSPGVVLLGGAGTSVGYRELNTAFELAVGGVPVVALHRNMRFQTADGPALDMGAFIVGLEAAARIEIPVVGKPSPDFFLAALVELGVEATETVIVGDDIDSDVRGGQAVGMTGVLVKTGKYLASDLETEGQSPDYVIDDIRHLSELL
jgi:HAD superfamily hydrolase (TIGR01458 family)